MVIQSTKEKEITMSLTFSDGMTFNTSGPLRLAHRRDGWYVVGEGTLIPVESQEEGERFIAILQKKENKENNHE
tara:strand:+ start:120 stop:341 length:222 start_codon:yes stop_codon:yes gene_type:complete